MGVKFGRQGQIDSTHNLAINLPPLFVLVDGPEEIEAINTFA